MATKAVDRSEWVYPMTEDPRACVSVRVAGKRWFLVLVLEVPGGPWAVGEKRVNSGQEMLAVQGALLSLALFARNCLRRQYGHCHSHGAFLVDLIDRGPASRRVSADIVATASEWIAEKSQKNHGN